jgi:hypothetical protein
MDIPTHAELVERINSFLLRHDMKPSRFGRDAMNEPQLVLQLRQGREPTIGTLNKLLTFMARRDAERIEAAERIIEAHHNGDDAPAHRLTAGAR